MKIFQLLALVVSLFVITPFQASAQADITPELWDRMQAEPNAFLPTAILLHDRVDVATLYQDWTANNWTQAQRIQVLLPSLEAKAKDTQAPLLDYLRNHPDVQPGTVSSTWVVNMIFLHARPSLIEELSQRTDIDWIGEDLVMEPSEAVRADESAMLPFDQTRERSLEVIGATDLWELGYTGYGRKALIIDTGNEAEHPALRSQYWGHWANRSASWSGTGAPVPCTEDGGGFSDHGTHVTGTICGIDRITEDTIGVAYNGQWMGGGVFLQGCDDYNGGSVQSIFQTFQWALNPDGNSSTVDDMPDAINNSWNSPPTSNCNNSPYIDLAYTMNAAGIAVVFSAANRGPDPSTIGAPAGLALDIVTIFCVANININGSDWAVNPGSSRGPTLCQVSEQALSIKPEVGAPGTAIRSAVTGGGYDRFTGTSMAAPHVAGTILLLREAFPDLMGVQLLEALYYTCTDLGEPGEDNDYGQGMINVMAAYNYLVDAGHTPTPPVSVDRDMVALNLETALLSCDEEFNFQFAIENGGNDTIRSLDIYYELDDQARTNGTFPWTGVLAPGDRLFYASPPIAASSGNYELTTRAALPNGTPDARFLNNQMRAPLSIIDEVSPDLQAALTTDCSGGRNVLTVTNLGPDDQVSWYSTPDDILARGAAWLTPALSEAVTYTAEVERHRQTGLSLNDNTANTINERAGALIFDCFYPFTLETFKVKIDQDGGRQIRLLNSAGQVLKSRIYSLRGAGEHTINFGARVPIGEDYRLEVSTGRPLYYQATGAPFPIRLEPILSIKRSNGDGISTRAYAHFYDWTISYEDYCGPYQIELMPGSIDAVPDARFEASSTELTIGENDVVTFTNLSMGASSYRWDFGDGITSMEAEPEHQYTTPGTYYVSMVATSADGCESAWLETIEVEADQTVNTVEIQLSEAQLVVFPNPATDRVYLELPDESALGGQLQVLDVNGRLLHQTTWRDALHTLETGTWPTGLYILRYEQAGRVIIGRVVKE